MKNKISSIAKDGLKYGIGSVAQRFVGILLVPVYTRIFVPADYGVMNIIFTASSLLTTLLTLGMSGAFFRDYHEYDDKEKVALVSTIQLFRLLVSVAVCIILSFLSVRLSNILLRSGQYRSLILISLVTVVFSVGSNLPIDVFRVHFKIMEYNCLQIGRLLLQVTSAIILVVFLRYGLSGLFISHLISSFVVCIAAFWMIRGFMRFSIDLRMLKKALVFGVGFLPGLFTHWVTASSDRIFLSRYARLSDVGIYGISNQLASILQLVTSAFRTAWVPMAYRDFREDAAPEFFRKTGLYYAVLLSFIVLGCSLFSSDVLYLLTPESYHRSYLYVPILAYGLLFNGLNAMFGEGLNFANKPHYRSLSFFIGAAVNFGLNFYFIPRYQILGAAITTLLAYLVSLLVGYFLAIRFYPRIRYDLGKIFLVCGYCIPFIVAGFFLDQEYSLLNIFFGL